MLKTMEKKEMFLFVIAGMREGKNSAELAAEIGISRQAMYYYVRVLKKKGVIKKKEYGTWVVVVDESSAIEDLLEDSDKIGEKEVKNCEVCTGMFTVFFSRQKYCSDRCRSKKHRQRKDWKIFARDKFTCIYCGKTSEDGVELHVDHIKPVARGGNSEIDNLVTSCVQCNLSKGDEYDPELIVRTRETVRQRNRE